MVSVLPLSRIPGCLCWSLDGDGSVSCSSSLGPNPAADCSLSYFPLSLLPNTFFSLVNQLCQITVHRVTSSSQSKMSYYQLNRIIILNMLNTTHMHRIHINICIHTYINICILIKENRTTYLPGLESLHHNYTVICRTPKCDSQLT